MKTKKATKELAEIGKLVKTADDYVGEFKAKMSIGINAIKEAAEIYVAALRSHPTTAQQKFADSFPAVAQNSWDTLRMIGNHDLNPMAFLLPRVTVKRIASIPVEKQEKIFSSGNKGFKVYDVARDDEKVVQIADMTPSQVDLVIDTKAGRVRSVDEQKSIMVAAKRQVAEIVEAQPTYIVNGKSVSFLRNTVIGIKELKRILREMGEA